MKKTYKFLIIAIFAVVLMMFAIPAFANEPDVNTPDKTNIELDTSVSENEDTPPATDYDKPANPEAAANIFALIYNTALSYSAEFFSLLSLIGTMFISYFYKRGLLPSVKSTLSTLGSAVGKIKEANDRQCEEQKSTAEKTAERLDRFENTLALYGESLNELRRHLISEEEMRKQRAMSDIVLSSQVDMLYDIFMTSSIPHYQKEATGERINKMRKEIEDYEKA